MVKTKLEQIISLMEEVESDTSIPRNVRKAVSDAKEKMKSDEVELRTRASSAIYLLDEVSNDINMPMHARTQIWTLMSALETVKS
ncbi:MAG: UPF0147 family protein [Candidatus Micrarchaeota archaeon]|nr:UPF0147 family protein [Candidatus Micrarchaeota archaeon]